MRPLDWTDLLVFVAGMGLYLLFARWYAYKKTHDPA